MDYGYVNISLLPWSREIQHFTKQTLPTSRSKNSILIPYVNKHHSPLMIPDLYLQIA